MGLWRTPLYETRGSAPPGVTRTCVAPIGGPLTTYVWLLPGVEGSYGSPQNLQAAQTGFGIHSDSLQMVYMESVHQSSFKGLLIGIAKGRLRFRPLKSLQNKTVSIMHKIIVNNLPQGMVYILTLPSHSQHTV